MRRILAFVLLTFTFAWCAGAQTVISPATAPASQGSSREAAPTVSAGVRALAEAAGNQDFRKIINSAKAKVFPAVVFIRCAQQNFERGERTTDQVAGSGVIISESGEVLTNWHVVDKAVEVRCLLYDGEAYEASVIGSDKDVDLALLKLGKPLVESAAGAAAKTAFPFARLGDSEKIQEGDFVMAMGAPWGLSRSVSLGIISCTRRYLPTSSQYSIWLQTDASISPGNSGGPLVNTDGEVVGINTRGVTEGGDIGFSVPSSTIVPIIAQLRKEGKVNWSWSGVQLQPLKDFTRNIYFEGTQGVIVAETDPDSPVRLAGLQARDRIMKINGTAVAAMTDEDLPELRRMLGLLPRTAPATLEIVRGTTPMTITFTPREKGQVEGDSVALARWDCSVSSINQFDNPDLYFQKKQGVFIFGIKYPGNAQNSGLQRQDILLKINGKSVNTLEEVKNAHAETVKTAGDNPRVMLTVQRNGLMRQVVLDISRDYSKQ
jgi:serine protease Do